MIGCLVVLLLLGIAAILFLVAGPFGLLLFLVFAASVAVGMGMRK